MYKYTFFAFCKLIHRTTEHKVHTTLALTLRLQKKTMLHTLENVGALELHQSYLNAEKQYRNESKKLRNILIFLQEEIVNIKRLKEDKLERRDEMLDQLEDLLL